MANRKTELKKLNREQQDALCVELKIEVDDNKNEDEVIALIIEAEEKAKLEAEEKAKVKKIKVNVIAKGKSITSKKGILSEGDEVDEKCFADKKVFDNLVKAKFIVEVEKEVK